MGCVGFAGPLWRRNTGGVGNPMTFAETSLPRPGWTPVSETKTPSIGLGTSPIRTAGKKNKPLR
jgi:hypothetical protein